MTKASEISEQEVVVEYCDLRDIPIVHIPNEGNCTDVLKENALALIKSQEQRIEAYRQELAEVRVALAEANKEREELTVDLKAMRGAANSYKIHITELTQAHEMLSESYNHLEKTKDELLSERARITEENARLEKLCALRDQDNKDTQDLLYKAEAENDRLMRDKTALECIVETARNQAKADTVREMQDRFNRVFGGMDATQVLLRRTFDQIAKEMIGEGK